MSFPHARVQPTPSTPANWPEYKVRPCRPRRTDATLPTRIEKSHCQRRAPVRHQVLGRRTPAILSIRICADMGNVARLEASSRRVVCREPCVSRHSASRRGAGGGGSDHGHRRPGAAADAVAESAGAVGVRDGHDPCGGQPLDGAGRGGPGGGRQLVRSVRPRWRGDPCHVAPYRRRAVLPVRRGQAQRSTARRGSPRGTGGPSRRSRPRSPTTATSTARATTCWPMVDSSSPVATTTPPVSGRTSPPSTGATSTIRWRARGPRRRGSPRSGGTRPTSDWGMGARSSSAGWTGDGRRSTDHRRVQPEDEQHAAPAGHRQVSLGQLPPHAPDVEREGAGEWLEKGDRVLQPGPAHLAAPEVLASRNSLAGREHAASRGAAGPHRRGRR